MDAAVGPAANASVDPSTAPSSVPVTVTVNGGGGGDDAISLNKPANSPDLGKASDKNGRPNSGGSTPNKSPAKVPAGKGTQLCYYLLVWDP